MKRIGYVGLGIMGAPMAKNLARAGFEVVVWNRTASKADPVLDAGARWVESPAEVAAATEAVCVNVTATADVEAVIFGEEGLLAGNPGDTAGMTIIDHSTIDPGATRGFAERLLDEEIDLLDAPVSGGDSGARAGTLSIMVGGRREAYDRCLPILEVNGGRVTHCGPSGAGQATKACNQVLCAGNLLATCEALGLAKREGLDLGTTIEVTGAGAGASWQLSNLGPKIAAGDTAPGFMIDLLNKDLSIVADAARRHGLAMPGQDTAAGLFRAAAANGLGREGTQALCRIVEWLGGFRYADDRSVEESD